MSVHVLLTLINEFEKEITECEACRAFYDFFATSLTNSLIQMLESIYYILESHSCRKNVIML